MLDKLKAVLAVLLVIVSLTVGVIQLMDYFSQNEPPKAEFTISRENPKIGSLIIFDASGSNDPDGHIIYYKWNFGDNNYGTGRVVEHNYSEIGSYIVKLDVSDNNHKTITKTDTVLVVANKLPKPDFFWEPINPQVGDNIIFDGSKSDDYDGSIMTYYWEFGDGGHSSDPSPQHTYTEAGKYKIRLDVTDDYGESACTNRTITIVETDHPIRDQTNDLEQGQTYEPDLGDRNHSEEIMNETDDGEFTIDNVLDGSQVAQTITLIGEYPANLEDDIWVFVNASNGKYYPQSIDPGNTTWKTLKIDGKWEVPVSFGGSENVGEIFQVVLMVADQEASKNISENMKRWSDSNYYPGWDETELPLGLEEVQRITVKRSAETLARAPEISNADLSGEVSFANIADGSLVNTSMDIYGNCTSDLEGWIWLLVYPTNARWYPQSSDPCNGIHLNKTDETWQGLGTFIGTEFDVVAVLANDNANDFFDEKQREWCQNNNDYPGLLTLELPQGIMEKDRARVRHI